NTQGILSVYCGTGMWGHSGDGGLAIHATTFASTKIRLDKYGNMFIPDGGTIRKIDQASGIIDRVAGTGAYSFNGDGGPALQASFAGPVSTYFDIFYNLFIADKNNYRIRKISGLTSIEQVPVLSYTVSPNPSIGKFNIVSDQPLKRIEVRNILGQIVLCQSVNNTKTSIDISAKADGLYIITVYGET